jgi:uncharacterized protein
MPKGINFEIKAYVPERAAHFYSKVFGWKIQKWDGPGDYWLISTGRAMNSGVDGGLTKRNDMNNSLDLGEGFSYRANSDRNSALNFGSISGVPASDVHTIDVESIDESVSRVIENGGEVIISKMAVPGIGYIAYCLDTEGNTFGVVEEDWSA